MSAQERIERGDALYRLLTQLRGADFGGHPECAETDPEVFFPERGQIEQLRTAREICGRCPVQAACLEMALRNKEHGFWGGTSEKQRRAMRRRRHLAVVPDEQAGDVAA